MDFGYEAGIRGLKQISKAMRKNGIGSFEKYTSMFLDRLGYTDWYRKE